jgi:hypothetical protein
MLNDWEHGTPSLYTATQGNGRWWKKNRELLGRWNQTINQALDQQTPIGIA